MKKIICLTISFILILSLFNIATAAADGIQLQIEEIGASVGETVTVELSITQNPGFVYLIVTLDYDNTSLRLDSVENGTLVKDFDQGVNLAWSADDTVNATGVLATLTFTVLDNTSGDYTVTVKPRECYDENYSDVTVSVQAGKINVETNDDTNNDNPQTIDNSLIVIPIAFVSTILAFVGIVMFKKIRA